MTTEAKVIFSAEDRASDVIRRLGSTVESAQTSFARLAAPLVQVQALWGSLVGGAIVVGVRNMVGAIDELDQTAQSLGTTASELANMRIVAGQAGIGVEQFDTAITRLNVKLSDAAAGNREASALFRALGINVKDAAGSLRPTTEVLRELADAFARMEDGPAKSALAVDVFGKGAARLIPLLNQGSGALEKMAGLTEETARQAVKLQAEFNTLEANSRRLGYALAGVVVPAINEVIETSRKLDFKSIAGSFLGSGPGGALGAVANLSRQLGPIQARQQQVAEALKLGEGAYSNEGRAALQNAQAIRDKVAADLAATDASKKKSAATSESSNAYAKEFADVQRIRNARKRFDDEQEEAAQREKQRREDRLNELTGRSVVKQQIEDMAALDEAFFSGAIAAGEYDRGISKVFGLKSEAEEGMKRQADLAEQLGLTMASSLGEMITSGGRIGSVWKALGQDIAKILTQMLILKPLAAELQKIFSEFGLGSMGTAGGGGSSVLSGLFKFIGGAIGGSFGGGTGAGTGGGTFDTYMGGAAAGAQSITVNNFIDSGSDRAKVAQLVDLGVRSGLAASWDSQRRGGSGVLA
jgi:hypothetical protein